MSVRIVGWGHTKFGRLEDNLEQLIVKAAKEAIEHAGVDPTDIDGIWLGHYNGGLVSDGFPSSLALQIDPQLRFTPSTRLENACASGSAAIHGARNAINSGNAKIALIIGVDRLLDMTRTAVNVCGDAMVSCVVAVSEDEFDADIFHSEK